MCLKQTMFLGHAMLQLLHVMLLLSVKYDLSDLQITLSNISEFHEALSEMHTLLMAVNEYRSILSTFVGPVAQSV